MRPLLLALVALGTPFLVLLLDAPLASVLGARGLAVIALATSLLAGAFAVVQGLRAGGRERGISLTMGAAAVMLNALLLWRVTALDGR